MPRRYVSVTKEERENRIYRFKEANKLFDEFRLKWNFSTKEYEVKDGQEEDARGVDTKAPETKRSTD